MKNFANSPMKGKLTLPAQIENDPWLNEKEKMLLFLLKCKIFSAPDIKVYEGLIKKGYIEEIPDCKVLSKTEIVYKGVRKPIYMN